MWNKRGPEGVAWKVMGKEKMHVRACMEPWPNSLFFWWNKKVVFGYSWDIFSFLMFFTNGFGKSVQSSSPNCHHLLKISYTIIRSFNAACAHTRKERGRCFLIYKSCVNREESFRILSSSTLEECWFTLVLHPSWCMFYNNLSLLFSFSTCPFNTFSIFSVSSKH